MQLVVGVAAALAGAAMLWRGLVRAWHGALVWRTAERVSGRVVRHVPVSSDDDDSPGTVRLEVAFHHAGRAHVHLTSYSSMAPLAVGRPVTVLVPRGVPQQAQVATLGALLLLPALLVWLGVAFLAAGLAIVASARARS